MNIKKVFPFLAAILITAFLCLTAFVFLLRPQALEIGTVDLNIMADGEYSWKTRLGIFIFKELMALVMLALISSLSYTNASKFALIGSLI